jgi:hypothetical protein
VDCDSKGVPSAPTGLCIGTLNLCRLILFKEKEQGIVIDEPTLRCHHNPLVGALGIQEPVILGEPQVNG